MSVNYFDTLSEGNRERLFAEMRRMDRAAMDFEAVHRRLSPPAGTIPVGAAHFDSWIRGYALQCFVAGLRKGLSPADARRQANVHRMDAVWRHNARRNDVNWRRSDIAGEEVLCYWSRRLDALTDTQE